MALFQHYEKFSPLARAVLFAVLFVVLSGVTNYFRGTEDLVGKLIQNTIVGCIAAVPMYFLFKSQAKDKEAS